MNKPGFTCRQSFIITLAPDSAVLITEHKEGGVELHGYDFSDTFGTWGVIFHTEHLPALEDLVRKLRETVLLENFRQTQAAQKNGT